MRKKGYDGKYAADAVLFDVLRYVRDRRYGYVRPATMARDMDISLAEAHLALRIWKEWKHVDVRSSDGRWFYDNEEPWRTS